MRSRDSRFTKEASGLHLCAKITGEFANSLARGREKKKRGEKKTKQVIERPPRKKRGQEID